MQMISPVKVIAACAGLSGFSIAILAGLAAGNAADVILARSIVAMFACYLVGGVVGFALDFAINDAMRRYKEEKPSPLEEPKAAGETRQAA